MKKRKGAGETPNNNCSRTNIKHFTNVNKTKDKTPDKAKQHNDSNTKVHFSDYVNERWKHAKREPRTIRQNDKLYSEFKPIAQRLYGSVCRAIESFEAAVVIATEQKVHFSNTERPINIERIVIERNLRSRRKLELAEDDEELRCHYCSNVAVGMFRYVKTHEVYPLCGFHAEEFLNGKAWEAA